MPGFPGSSEALSGQGAGVQPSEPLQCLPATMREGTLQSALTLREVGTKSTSGKLSLSKSLPKPFYLWHCLRLEPINLLLVPACLHYVLCSL